MTGIARLADVFLHQSLKGIPKKAKVTVKNANKELVGMQYEERYVPILLIGAEENYIHVKETVDEIEAMIKE